MSIIAVDVDLTVVESDLGWFDHLNRLTGKNYSRNDQRFWDYDTLAEYGITDHETRELALDYWRRADLYDDLEPIPGSVDVLRYLHRSGHTIIFVSVLKGDHHKSKFNFIERNFPFMSAFIGTKEKAFVDADLLIDDRVENLYSFTSRKNRAGLLYDTPYKQRLQGVWNNHSFSWTQEKSALTAIRRALHG